MELQSSVNNTSNIRTNISNNNTISNIPYRDTNNQRRDIFGSNPHAHFKKSINGIDIYQEKNSYNLTDFKKKNTSDRDIHNLKEISRESTTVGSGNKNRTRTPNTLTFNGTRTHGVKSGDRNNEGFLPKSNNRITMTSKQKIRSILGNETQNQSLNYDSDSKRKGNISGNQTNKKIPHRKSNSMKSDLQQKYMKKGKDELNSILYILIFHTPGLIFYISLFLEVCPLYKIIQISK